MITCWRLLHWLDFVVTGIILWGEGFTSCQCMEIHWQMHENVLKNAWKHTGKCMQIYCHVLEVLLAFNSCVEKKQ